MKFLVDENLPLSTAEMLRSEEFGADHVRELGMKGADDQEVVNKAKKDRYIVVTKDLEFGSPEHYELELLEGVIVIRLSNNLGPSGLNNRLREFLNNYDKDLRERVIVLEKNRYRSRKIDNGNS